MIDELYSREILRRTTQLAHVGRLEAPDGAADRTAKLCGSTIHVDVKFSDGVITDFAQEVEACALGQAAAAILSQSVIGAPVVEVVAARDAMKTMLKGGEYAYPERFADFAILQSVKDFPARHASTLLALEATVEAVGTAG
ncbi:iron-sulfur cluster assembly scaffold protein [Asticcacaulis sp.]|uniref:iron-sulfur cluster assembly scaffold protein n=1 Tax=Asticcacaulis sp. TaxID=1872648 RepID=UPI00261B84C0|nr:iron-sulfur cluster assembly scaffold protein [Asticcacaulis sp.]